MKTVYCAGGCECTVAVSIAHVASDLADMDWMVLIHGIHKHLFAFCSIACIQRWCEIVPQQRMQFSF